MRKRTVTSFTLDRELLEQVKAMAVAEGRSLSNMVETILKRWIKERRPS